MTSAELFKLRTQRTPLVCAVVLMLGVVAPSAVLLWYAPSDAAAYTDAFGATYGILPLLLSIVFGGWLLGTEYRQGTVKRLLTSEPRRLRALATKGLVGAGALSAVLTVAGVVGWGAARIVGSMNEVTVGWDGRGLLAAGLTALIGGAVAFGLSAVTRSDSFAMVGTVALLLVLDPLLSLIPKVGDYTFGSALTTVSDAVAGAQTFEPAALSTSAGLAILAVWLGAFLVSGAALFTSRDV